MPSNQANSQEPTMEEILASIRRIISEDSEEQPPKAEEAKPKPAAQAARPAPKPAPEPEPVFEEESEEDVLELTDIVEEAPEPEPEEDVVLVAPPPKREAPLPRPEPAPFRSTPRREPDALIADEVANKAASAFTALSRNMRIADAEPMSLEHVVKEMLKPMLQEWLNANLPGIVENLVQQEIDRVARRGQS